MTFEEILDHAIAMLQRWRRVTYSTLKLQFQLDDVQLAALKDELLYSQPHVVDDAGRGLVWTGDTASVAAPSAAAALGQAQAPLAYTPPYLAEKILTTRSAMEGERKQVSVLFADLKGNTELIRDLDPEAGQTLLDTALHAMMDAVHRFEGTVNDVAGDGLMAMFGAPIAHEDHALRACYAALAMQAAMRRYADEVRRTHGLEVLLRVGLNSGGVLVRTIGNDLYMNYSGVGLTTNLAARMEQLAPPGTIRLTAATLQTAAVIGTEVPLALLQTIAEEQTEILHQSLAHLQTSEFLYETQLFPDQVYMFKHALTHEVAYDSLLQNRRRVLHAQIVAALEALAGDRVAEQVERLAHHALRGEVWDKALVYCRQAGEKAMARPAYREAVEYFEQALRALQHLPEQRDTREQAIDLRLALRTALRPSGDSARILAYLHEAEALAAALDDPRRLGQLSISLSAYFRFMGAYDQAIATAQRALALATTGGEVVLHAQANASLGYAYRAQGDYRRASDCLRQTVVSLEGARRHELFGQVFLPVVNARAWLAVCHAELGMFAEGTALGEEGLRIAEAVAHPASLMLALWGIGLLSLRQGDLRRALPLLSRAVGLCQDADLPVWFPLMAPALGAAYTLAGRIADAVPLLMQAMEQATVMERVDLQARCHLSLGVVQLLTDRLEDAHALAERALAHARGYQERGDEAYALHLLGEIAARRDPPESEQAEAYYQQALTLAEELGMRPLQAHCHHGLGTLYAATGQRQQARAALSTAIEMYRAMAMTFWLPQAETALAQME